MRIKYSQLIIITFVSCLLPLVINSHDDDEGSGKQTDEITISPSDYLGDIASLIGDGILAASEDLSFRYTDGELISSDGQIDGGLDDFELNITIKGTGLSGRYRLVWEVVVKDVFSNSVRFGLKYEYVNIGTLAILKDSISITLKDTSSRVITIGDYLLHAIDSNEDEDASNGNDGGGSSNGSGGGGPSHNNEEASYDSSDNVEWHDDEDAYVDIGEIEVLGVVDDDDYYYYYYYYYEEEEGDYEDIDT